MKSINVRELVLASGCLLSFAAFGCGTTGDGLDTSAESSNLQGGPNGQVLGARGDAGWDHDKDVDEAADEAAKAAQGAAGGAVDPHDGKGSRGDRFDDADGGVDERDCKGRGNFGWHEGMMRGGGKHFGGPGPGPGAAPGGGGHAGAPSGGQGQQGQGQQGQGQGQGGKPDHAGRGGSGGAGGASGRSGR